jgi:hypothetical protein
MRTAVKLSGGELVVGCRGSRKLFVYFLIHEKPLGAECIPGSTTNKKQDECCHLQSVRHIQISLSDFVTDCWSQQWANPYKYFFGGGLVSLIKSSQFSKLGLNQHE